MPCEGRALHEPIKHRTWGPAPRRLRDLIPPPCKPDLSNDWRILLLARPEDVVVRVTRVTQGLPGSLVWNATTEPPFATYAVSPAALKVVVNVTGLPRRTLVLVAVVVWLVLSVM